MKSMQTVGLLALKHFYFSFQASCQVIELTWDVTGAREQTGKDSLCKKIE